MRRRCLTPALSLLSMSGAVLETALRDRKDPGFAQRLLTVRPEDRLRGPFWKVSCPSVRLTPGSGRPRSPGLGARRSLLRPRGGAGPAWPCHGAPRTRAHNSALMAFASRQRSTHSCAQRVPTWLLEISPYSIVSGTEIDPTFQLSSPSSRLLSPPQSRGQWVGPGPLPAAGSRGLGRSDVASSCVTTRAAQPTRCPP